MGRVAPTTDELREFIARLALVDGRAPEGLDVRRGVDASVGFDADRLELIAVLEAAKAALAAAQARVTVAFDASQRAAQRGAGLPAAMVGAGVAEQVALARRDSPARGSRHLGLAKALVHEMPHTQAALTAGELSEWRATLVVQATSILDVDARREVDERLAGRLGKLSDRQVRAAASAVAYELDPQSVVNRAAYAVTQRRVSLRPAPDTMAYLTALLPAAQAVAVFAALHGAASAARACGDSRSSDQVKADTLVERVTGQASAAGVSVEIGLVMTDASLLSGDRTPAVLSGYGPVPAPVARALARGGGPESEADLGLDPDPDSDLDLDLDLDEHPVESHGDIRAAQVWVRRLYSDPVTSSLIDGDRRRRIFPAHLRRLVVARDQWCRTPWCGAPIRHVDHAVAHGRGGLTELANAQGLCERCNHAKEATGWTTRVATDDVGRQVVTTTTSSGLAYSSTAPPWNPAAPALSALGASQPTPDQAGELEGRTRTGSRSGTVGRWSPGGTVRAGSRIGPDGGNLVKKRRVTGGAGPGSPLRRGATSRRAVDFAWAQPDSPWARLRIDLAPPA